MSERVFIVGTSSSILQEDLDLLSGETVFGLNTLPFYCPELITDYVAIEPIFGIIPEIRDELIHVTNRHYSRQLWNCMADEHVDTTHVFDLCARGASGFSMTPEKLYQCQTVAYVALQLAAQKHPKEIYLLGIDLRTELGHIPEDAELYSLMKKRRLHDPLQDKRFNNTASYTNRLTTLLGAFDMANNHCKKLGISIYNCSKQSRLTMFPYSNLTESLKEPVYAGNL